jgi:hypothetical protein
MAAKRAVERLLTGVAKRRMPDVVHQGEGFGEFRIQPQRRSRGARNLRYFESMCQAAAKVIGESFRGQAGKHLRLPSQAAKGARVQNPCGVAREGCAIRVGRLRMDASYKFAAGTPAGRNPLRQRGWRFVLERSHQLSSGYTAKGDSAVRRTLLCAMYHWTIRTATVKKSLCAAGWTIPGPGEYDPAGFFDRLARALKRQRRPRRSYSRRF